MDTLNSLHFRLQSAMIVESEHRDMELVFVNVFQQLDELPLSPPNTKLSVEKYETQQGLPPTSAIREYPIVCSESIQQYE
jgi:hypothetical protein